MWRVFLFDSLASRPRKCYRGAHIFFICASFIPERAPSGARFLCVHLHHIGKYRTIAVESEEVS